MSHFPTLYESCDIFYNSVAFPVFLDLILSYDFCALVMVIMSVTLLQCLKSLKILIYIANVIK